MQLGRDGQSSLLESRQQDILRPNGCRRCAQRRLGLGTVFFDYDNDGDLDLVMTNGVDFILDSNDLQWNADKMRLWCNDNGSFSDVSTAQGIVNTGSGKGLLTFDYDNDGDLDLFVVNNGSAHVLYRNNNSNTNSWLKVKASGSISNRDGIGALVTITPISGGSKRVSPDIS